MDNTVLNKDVGTDDLSARSVAVADEETGGILRECEWLASGTDKRHWAGGVSTTALPTALTAAVLSLATTLTAAVLTLSTALSTALSTSLSTAVLTTLTTTSTAAAALREVDQAGRVAGSTVRVVVLNERRDGGLVTLQALQSLVELGGESTFRRSEEGEPWCLLERLQGRLAVDLSAVENAEEGRVVHSGEGSGEIAGRDEDLIDVGDDQVAPLGGVGDRGVLTEKDMRKGGPWATRRKTHPWFKTKTPC